MTAQYAALCQWYEIFHPEIYPEISQKIQKLQKLAQLPRVSK